MKSSKTSKITLPGIGDALLIRSRRRSMQIEVSPDGMLKIRIPSVCAIRSVEAFVAEKTAWIKRKRREFKQECLPYQPRHFKKGELFWFLGRQYPLEIVESADCDLIFCRECFYMFDAVLNNAKNIFIDWYKKQAECIIKNRTEELAVSHGFNYSRCRISSARTRWGSCSASGVLSFSWRLIMASPAVIDMIIMHELCHLAVPNHSSRFRELLGGMLPDFRVHEQWLRRHSCAFDI